MGQLQLKYLKNIIYLQSTRKVCKLNCIKILAHP